MPKAKKGDVLNPQGKGGFGDNPHHRADGRWSKEGSISYCMNMFSRMPGDQFKDWINNNPNCTPAQEAAWNAVNNSKKDIGYLKEVADRTEGKALQKTELTGADGKDLTPPTIIIQSTGVQPITSENQLEQFIANFEQDNSIR